jgi:hypothetical protein
MIGVISSLPKYAFMAWYSAKKKHRGNFTFTCLIFPLQKSSELSISGAPEIKCFKHKPVPYKTTNIVNYIGQDSRLMYISVK